MLARAAKAVARAVTRDPLMVVVLASLVTLAVIFLVRRREFFDASTWTCASRPKSATCPGGGDYCFWGDKGYNKGKCCKKPWSTACVPPKKATTTTSLPQPQCDATVVEGGEWVIHEGGSCWNHGGKEEYDPNVWKRCYGYLGTHKCTITD